jgi:hypothetical protein
MHFRYLGGEHVSAFAIAPAGIARLQVSSAI